MTEIPLYYISLFFFGKKQTKPYKLHLISLVWEQHITTEELDKI